MINNDFFYFSLGRGSFLANNIGRFHETIHMTVIKPIPLTTISISVFV